jgi:hypothetical protein
MLKNISIWVLFSAVAFGILGKNTTENAFIDSLAAGTAIVLFNLAGLTLIWRMIFSKKYIALAAFAIIFKYLILGMILWKLSSAKWLNSTGLLLGLLTLVTGVLLATLQKSISEKFSAKK